MLKQNEKSSPDTIQNLHCVRSFFKNIVVIWALSLAVVLSACNEGGRSQKSNMVDMSALEQRLLFDAEEIEEYLKLFPLEEYEIVDVPNLGKFYLDDSPSLVKWALRAGKLWEPKVKQVMASHTVLGSTALDVGAHIGSHTLTLARLVGPRGVVYAFEPQKKIYRELVKNLELNGIKNAVPLRFCIGSQHDIIEMNPVKVFDGATHVGKGGDKAEMRTIDSFGFSNVSMIKIDVEGYQIPVLKGAEQTIRAWHPAIILEILYADRYEQLPPKLKKKVNLTRQILEQFGYELTLIACWAGCDFLALYKGGNNPT